MEKNNFNRNSKANSSGIYCPPSEFKTWEDAVHIEDSIQTNEFQIDLVHITEPKHIADLESVLTEDSINLSRLEYADIFHRCIPLAGVDYIARWKKKLDHFPDSLRIKLVQEHSSYFVSGNIPVHLARKDFNVLYSLISGLHKRIFLTLLALNRKYFSGYKHMTSTLEQLSIKPHGTHIYSNNFYLLPADELWRQTKELMIQTLDLIEKENMGIDTHMIRGRLNEVRKSFPNRP